MASTMASTTYLSLGPLPQPGARDFTPAADALVACDDIRTGIADEALHHPQPAQRNPEWPRNRAAILSIARPRTCTCYPDLNLHSLGSLRPDAAHPSVCYRLSYEPDRRRPVNAYAACRDYRSRKTAKQDRARLAELFHREALHDAPGWRHDVVARRQADRVHLQPQRAQQSVAGARDWRVADAADHQRSAAGATGVVAGWDMDRLHLRPRWRRAVGRVPGLAQDRRCGEPDGLARERRRRANVVARRTAARVHYQAENGLELRDRTDGRDYAPCAPPDAKHAQGAEQQPSHFFARWQAPRLYPIACHRQRLEHLPARSRQRAEHEPHAT